MVGRWGVRLYRRRRLMNVSLYRRLMGVSLYRRLMGVCPYQRLNSVGRHNELAHHTGPAQGTSGSIVDGVAHRCGVPDQQSDFLLAFDAQFLPLLE